MTTYFLGALAGLLTTLSPCVLPVLPFIARSSSSISRWGPIALGFGMILSFVAVGFSILAFGQFMGLNSETLKHIGASLMIIAGLSLAWSKSQAWVAKLLSPLGARSDAFISKQNTQSLGGQFFLGSLIGLVWSPCTGPTLGAAVGLAAQTETQTQAILLMTTYALGAVIPLMLVTYASRTFMQSRGGIMNWAEKSKKPMGLLLIGFGIMINLGLDKKLETFFLNHAPDFWVNLITSY